MIPENKIGDFRIEHRDGLTILWEDNRWWMSDADCDQRSQDFVVKVVRGKVLIIGLGVGCIVERLQVMPGVTEIVVVEVSKDVIDLVWQYLDVPKATIVHMDGKEYLATAEGFDYIYIDVWLKSGHEFIPEWRKAAEQIVAPDRVLCWGEKKNPNRKEDHGKEQKDSHEGKGIKEQSGGRGAERYAAKHRGTGVRIEPELRSVDTGPSEYTGNQHRT